MDKVGRRELRRFGTTWESGNGRHSTRTAGQILNMAKQFEIIYSRRLLELQQFPLTSPTEHSYRSVYVP